MPTRWFKYDGFFFFLFLRQLIKEIMIYHIATERKFINKHTSIGSKVLLKDGFESGYESTKYIYIYIQMYACFKGVY